MPVSGGDRLDLAICPDSTKVTFKVFNSNSHTLNLAEVYIVVLAVVKPGVADVLVPGSSSGCRVPPSWTLCVHERICGVARMMKSPDTLILLMTMEQS